jgi:hypothetical protein
VRYYLCQKIEGTSCKSKRMLGDNIKMGSLEIRT